MSDQLIGSVRKNHAEEIRVSLTESKGRLFIDIRVFKLTGPASQQATRRGIPIRPESLSEIIGLLVEAGTQAREAGLL